MNSRYYILGSIIILAVAGGFFWLRSAGIATPQTGDQAGIQGAPTPPTSASIPAPATPPAPAASTSQEYNASGTVSDSAMPDTGTVTMVTYTDQGFAPKTVTIKKGETVMWTNKSREQMDVAVNPHPTHNGYDGTTRQQHCAPGGKPSFDQCASGDTYTFTFTKVGQWSYHNHFDTALGGTVVVQ